MTKNDEIAARLDAAKAEVYALCEGHKTWTMSIFEEYNRWMRIEQRKREADDD